MFFEAAMANAGLGSDGRDGEDESIGKIWGSDDEWNWDVNTGKTTWVSNKGGNNIDDVNITLGGTTFTNSQRVKHTTMTFETENIDIEFTSNREFGRWDSTRFKAVGGAIDQMDLLPHFFRLPE